MLFERDLEKSRKKAGRRRFLALAATAAGGWWAYRWWRRRPQELRQRVVQYLTPVKDFYKVSIYLGYRPDVRLDTWKLSFGDDSGAVFDLGYRDLLALPSFQLPKTFMCIENPVGREGAASHEAGISRKSGLWLVEGIAYRGAQPVGAVEVSADEQQTWQEAELTSPRRRNAWTTWRWLWRPPAPGSYTLAVRTRDASGIGQEEGYTGAFPSGSSGLHKVSLEI